MCACVSVCVCACVRVYVCLCSCVCVLYLHVEQYEFPNSLVSKFSFRVRIFEGVFQSCVCRTLLLDVLSSTPPVRKHFTALILYLFDIERECPNLERTQRAVETFTLCEREFEDQKMETHTSC